MVSFPLIGYVLKAAMRDKIFYGFILLIVCMVSFSIFMGSSAVIEKSQFVTINMAYSLRILAVMALTLFIAFFVRKLHDNRDLEFLLARPIMPSQMILSFLSAFFVLAILFSFLIFIAFILSGLQDLDAALFVWCGTLIVELAIVATAAFFFALVLPSAILTVMAASGFYLLCRIIGAILLIIEKHVTQGMHFMNKIMEGVSILVPRFDLISDSGWLIYGVQNVAYLPWFFLHAAIFIVILIIASYLDLMQKQF